MRDEYEETNEGDFDVDDNAPLAGDMGGDLRDLDAERAFLEQEDDDGSSSLSPAEIEELIITHLDYARALTLKIARGLPDHVDREELVAFGQYGLTQAAQRFRPGSGAKFSTYAHFRIRGAVFDGIRKSTWLPPDVRKGALRNEIVDELHESGDLGGDHGETMDRAALEFTKAIRTLGMVFNLSDLAPDDDEDGSISDPAARTEDGEGVEKSEVVDRLLECVRQLGESEQQLLQLIYFKGMSMREAGDVLGVDKATVCRRHKKILDDLRGFLEP